MMCRLLDLPLSLYQAEEDKKTNPEQAARVREDESHFDFSFSLLHLSPSFL